MKKTIALLLCALSLFSLSACGSDVSVPTGMMLASGKIADYYLFVPGNWTVNSATGITSAYVSTSDRTNVSVTSYALPDKDTTARDYFEKHREEISSVFTEMSEPEVSDTTLDETPAVQYVYSVKSAGADYKILQVYCVRGDSSYIFTFTATPEKYEEHLEKVGIILAEFRFM